MRHALLLLGLPLTLLACRGECPEGDCGDAQPVADGGGGEDGGDGGSDDGGEAGDDGGGDEGGDDGADLEPVVISDITVELTDVVTVARVTWSTDQEVESWVEFGEGDGTTWTTSVSTGTEHEVLLLGTPADTEVTLRVHAEPLEADAGELEGSTSEDLAYTTGSLPSGLPVLNVTGDYVPEWNFQVLPLQGTSFSVVIVDNQGRIVWYDVQANEGNLMRAVVSSARDAVILCHAGQQDSLEEGRILWLPLDGGEVTRVDLPYVDHDMVELPDGTIGAIRVQEGTTSDGKHTLADQIVEMDADGNVTVIWDAWDHIDPVELGVPTEMNWTHGNGLDYLPEEDAYILSMKTLGTLVKVDRATGESLWMLNGKANEFEFSPETEPVPMQHQFEYLSEEAILIFDNGDPGRGYSRAVEFAIDQDALYAEQTWEYIRDPSVFVYAKGDVHRFSDGTTQVVWSSSGEMQLVDEAGTVLWQANSELGQAITFVQPFQSFYDNE